MKTTTILAIDDNYIDLYLNEFAINEAKFADNYVAKNSALEALEYLESLPKEQFPTVVLLDLNMPEMNGFEFLERFELFSDEKKDACSIVVLTSSKNPLDIEKAMSNKYVKLYLNKPLDEEHMNMLREL